MYCPQGYVPLSSAAIDFHEWLRAIVETSIDHGDPLSVKEVNRLKLNGHSLARAYRGFPLFLSDCESLAMCGFDGTILKPHQLFLLDRADFLWDRGWFPQSLKSWDYQFIFINPHTFTVSLNFWNNLLSKVLEENVNEDWQILQAQAEVISAFEGWALCISEEDDDRIPQYILEWLQLPETVLIDVKGTSESDAGHRRGRPPLSRAKEAFAKMKYDKGDRSWEQMSLHIERLTGQKPAHKTMRTWAEDAAQLSSLGD